jgi:predicted permease
MTVPRRWPNHPPRREPVRRALGETIADARHEVDAATSSVSRVARLVVSVVSVLRLFLAFAGVFEEGYPMRNFGRDLRYALRRLLAAPGFTIFSIVTLAIGIGATTAVVSVVRTVTGPPAGVRDPETVINLFQSPRGGLPFRTLGWADYQYFKAHQTSFERVMAWRFTQQAFAANGRAETAFGEIVDGNYFAVLGVGPAIGRVLQPADDQPGATPVVVISDRVWRQVFDAAPDAVGRAMTINGHAFQIVGVVPPSFAGLVNNGLVPSALWVSVSAGALLAAPGSTFPMDDNRDYRWLLVTGRLRPDRTLGAAQAEATVFARQLDAAYPIGQHLDHRYRLPGIADRPWALQRMSDGNGTAGGEAQPLVGPLVAALLLSVGLILMVACTNLANLMVARGSARHHEIAVRLALGATRWRLLREVLTESACVVLVGGLAGLAVARALVVVLAGDVDLGPAVLHIEPSVDAVVLLASAGAIALAMIVTGVVPALQSTRADVRAMLATEGVGAAVPRWRGRRWLITLQVSVSLALLAMATVCADQFRRELHRDTGVSLDRLAVGDVDFTIQRFETSRTAGVVDAVIAIMTRQPGVISAAAASGLPFGTSNPGCSVTTPDHPFVTDKFYGRSETLLASTPAIFQTLGVAIRKGRGFTTQDLPTSQAVAVVSEATAKALFDTTEVLGRQILFKHARWLGMDDPPVVMKTIIGVASETDAGIPGERESGTVYVPLAQQPEGRLMLVVRTSGDPATAIPILRRTIASIEPTLAVTQIGTGVAITGASNLFLQVTAGITGLLGTFALILALAGLYGALSHIVTRRTRELGIRMSLGASGKQIERMVVADGLRPVAIGVVIGLGVGLLARMALRPIFVLIIPSLDPFVVALAPTLILIAGALACYLPARRASRVDPNVALREL